MRRIANLSSFQQGISALKRRLGSSAAPDESASTIRQVIQELETMNRSTERDFLAVGDKLIGFRTSARQISSDMAAVAELISGKQGRNASRSLTGMLERSQEIDSRIERAGQALGHVRDLTSRLRRAFSGLTQMVAVFRNLCTLTQIETSRLGSAGAELGHLAAEIRPLSEGIQASGESVLSASSLLDRAVQGAIRNGADLRATELKEMPALIARVMGGLQSFDERRRAALEASGRQAAEYSALCEAIDDLVASLQFHDITRQQVEHVVQALKRLRSQWSTHPDRPDAGAVLSLQSSQLAEAARLFAQSMERIERNLKSIAARLRSASESVRELTGMSGGACGNGGSFFTKMETEFSGIFKMLSTCTAARTETDSAIAGLAETIGQMRNSVQQIRGTEIQIQRISTNSTIRATHIGVSGMALNKIAEIMQRLALESNTHTEEASATLDAMIEAVTAESAQYPSGAQPAKDQAAEAMRGAVAQLHSASESSATRTQNIAQLSARLAEDITALMTGISAGRMFAEAVARARQELEEIGARTGCPSSGDAASATKHLEQLATTYTMQLQRDVHASMLGQAAAPLAAAQATEPQHKELGNNVELF